MSGGAASSARIPDAEPDYARLADLLHGGNSAQRREAIKELLQIEPGAVKDKETKKRIARGFREIAFGEMSKLERGEAIRGLVIWGGKYANPLLVDLLDREKLAAPPEVFDGLAMLKEPEGAAAACRQLDNSFNRDAAVACLRKMGASAEDTLIKAAQSNNPKISLAAVNLLGEVGTIKSTDLLNRATKSDNLDIRDAARSAMNSIRERNKKSEQ
jgi:HEAT repeat protein